METFQTERLFKSALLFVSCFCLGIQLVQCVSQPWEPEEIPGNPAWQTLHTLHVNTTKANFETNKIRVIFLGDSITQGWGFPNWGKETWDKEYAPIGAFNYGIGGDKTQHVLWRIQNGGLEKLINPPPQLIVLCIGTNNIGAANTTVDDIVKGIETIVANLRQKLPQTKILLLGLFPRQNAWAFLQVASINLQIARLDSKTYGRSVNGSTETGYGEMVRFLDMWTHFGMSFGQVAPELFSTDELHLNAEGYTKWAQVMNSAFIEMLN